MTTVYLHIGLPKTATTTVQGAIQKLRPLLDPKGYWTPLGIMAHHRFAIEALDKSDPRFAWAHYQSILASGNDAVVSEVAAAVRERKHILISGEYLNDCGPQPTARLLAQFGVHARDVRIIVCLRRQDRFLESSYNQEVKGTGRTRPLVWSPRQVSPWDWYAKLSDWAGEFGDAALRVLVFERVTREAPGHLFADLETLSRGCCKRARLGRPTVVPAGHPGQRLLVLAPPSRTDLHAARCSYNGGPSGFRVGDFGSG